MRFTYQYKTSDGVRHDGTLTARSREAVYDSLKAQGVKPFNVALAPGLLNRVQSLGKRTLAIFVLAVIVVVALIVIRADSRRFKSIEQSRTSPMPRHQIYGDPALMDELERTGYSTVFSHPGNAFLARYAQPGVLVKRDDAFDPGVLVDCLNCPVEVDEGDAREVAELKRIVCWIREELREYLADGVGKPDGYVRRLNQRQRQEIELLERLKRDLAKEGDRAAIDEANKSLRRIGLPTFVVPEESERKSENTPLTNR